MSKTPDPTCGSETGNALSTESGGLEKATLGSGCFWCTEGVFQQLKGVDSVVSGYSGGHADHPTYSQVCSGTTGHAEVVQITFDPSVISYTEILDVFWRTHDPTTLNRQGNDVGTQYRSAIFYHNEQQRLLAECSLRQFDASNLFNRPIVTEVVAFRQFFRPRITIKTTSIKILGNRTADLSFNRKSKSSGRCSMTK